jgi:hypothetical protein
LTRSRELQQHPLLVVEDIAASLGAGLTFTYSRYQVAPPGLQAVAPRSSVLRASGCDVTPRWLADRLAELSPCEEMAWHSTVEYKGDCFHIPMIDFISRPSKSALDELGRALAAEIGVDGDFAFFETGRSFHGYLPGLIPQNAWPKYLGLLLIVNEQDRTPLIDTRWVGHALVRGFAALRWSHNTGRYQAMPSLLSVREAGL